VHSDIAKKMLEWRWDRREIKKHKKASTSDREAFFDEPKYLPGNL